MLIPGSLYLVVIPGNKKLITKLYFALSTSINYSFLYGLKGLINITHSINLYEKDLNFPSHAKIYR